MGTALFVLLLVLQDSPGEGDSKEEAFPQVLVLVSASFLRVPS